jgi:RIO-like serine/threonine protein kinase
LKKHRELATHPLVSSQLIQAVQATHAAGFAHHDIDAGNVIFVHIPDVQESSTLRIKLIDFAQAQKLNDTNKEKLRQRDANQLGRLCQW